MTVFPNAYAWRAVKEQVGSLYRNPLTRNTILLIANSIVTGAGGLFFWFAAARLYTAALVGVASAGTSMVVLLSGISQMGLGISIIRYSSALGPHRSRRLAGIFVLISTIALFTGTLFWWLAPVLASGLMPVFATKLDIVVFIASCVGWTFSVQYDNYLVSRRLMGLMVIENSITAVCRILIVLCIPVSSAALLIGITSLSGMVGTLAIAPFVARQKLDATATSGPGITTRAFAHYAFWSYCSGLAGTLSTLLMPTIIVGFVGKEQAAAYYMAWSLFSILLLLPSALSWAIFSEGSAKSPIGTYVPRIDQRNGDLLIVLITALFLPLALFMLRLLGSTYLAFGWTTLLFLALGTWPYYRGVLLMSEIRLTDSQRSLSTAYSVSSLVTIALSVALIRLIGVSGAALAWTLSQYVLFLRLRQIVRSNADRGVSQ
jgi:O-antigen/teichoic acid export membrane protein